MKQVSSAYKSSMKSPLRNRSYVEITFSEIDTNAAGDGTWSGNAQSYSEFDTLDYAYDYKNTYATLELNRWSLDAKSVILPSASSFTDGFISSSISDENGSLANTVVLTRTFTDSRTFPGVTLTFDTRESEYPKSVTADFYYNGSIWKTATAEIKGTKVEINAAVEYCDKIVFTFSETRLPYRRIRLQHTLYGVEKIFTNDDVVSTKQSHDVDPLSRRLPQETMEFTLLDYEHNYDPDNPQGIYAYLDEKSPIAIRFGYELPSGTVEWIKADRYQLNGKPTISNNQAKFSGTGLIGSLTGTYYKSKTGTKSFYDMAQDVLEDADLTLTTSGGNPWDIDVSLKEMYTTAVLPIDTHMNCLQLIAHACRCRLFTDDDNVIHIKPFGVQILGIYKGDWTDNGHTYYSEWDSVDGGNTFGNTFATLELNRWGLDGGEQVIIPDSDWGGRGYVSSQMTDSTGAFASTPIYTRNFDVSHDLPVVAFRFDTPIDEYPTDIKIQYYRDDELLDTQTISGISSSEIFATSELAYDCTRITVTALNALPYRRMRVTKMFYRETDYTLDFTSIDENSQTISKIDKLKEVSVSKYGYVAANTASTLFEGTTTETELHIEFSSAAQDVSISVTGGTLVSSAVYAHAADLVMSSGTKTIAITGKTLTENSIVTTYTAAKDGETDKEENPLITNDEMCLALANQVKQYLQMRNTYEASYRGNPELEAGDIIGLQTNYTAEMDALILKDEISYNGSLSGKVIVKGLI